MKCKNWLTFFYLLGLAEKHQITADEIDSNLVLKTAKTDETSQDENVKNTGKYTRQWTVDTTKGQLISECLFDILNFPKNQRKIWKISALEYKKRSNQLNKGTF